MQLKHEILKLVIKSTETRLNSLVHSALEAHDAATNTESKAENKYDTRGLEASYLAGAQSKRAKELEESLYYLKKISDESLISNTDAINLFSVVILSDDDGNKKHFFILPVQGGVVVELKAVKYQIITLSSPLGKSLLQRVKGDEIYLKTSNDEKYFEVLYVN